MKTLGENIRELRKRKGFSQLQLGDALGCSDKTISSWETNRTEPDKKMYLEMCRVLNCRLEDFFEGIPDYEKQKHGVRVPVLGRVQAGLPIEAVQNIIDWEEIPEKLARTGEFFGLQIKGSSMEPRYLEGDVVIVKKQPTIESGQIGVVLVDGTDAAVKKIMLHEEGLTLLSTNPAFPPIFYSSQEVVTKPVQVIGKVVELRGKVHW